MYLKIFPLQLIAVSVGTLVMEIIDFLAFKSVDKPVVYTLIASLIKLQMIGKGIGP